MLSDGGAVFATAAVASDILFGVAVGLGASAASVAMRCASGCFALAGGSCAAEQGVIRVVGQRQVMGTETENLVSFRGYRTAPPWARWGDFPRLAWPGVRLARTRNRRGTARPSAP